MTIKDKVSKILKDHYSLKFEKHGECPEGVDWGADPEDSNLRLNKMLAVANHGQIKGIEYSILDVGCGYGMLYSLIQNRGLRFKYTGVDICENMINSARVKHPEVEWIVGNVLDLSNSCKFDYIICNGIFTQKLSASIREMDAYLKQVLFKMFSLCDIGVAFNIMTTYVNYMSPNLYYKNPSDLIAWCMNEFSSKVMIDHSYPLYEYTVYIYKEESPQFVYGAHRMRER